MLETLGFLVIIGPAYIGVAVAGIFFGLTFFYGNSFLDKIYINLLLKIFAFASLKASKDNRQPKPANVNTVKEEERRRKTSSICYDYTILQREVRLSPHQGMRFHPSVQPTGNTFQLSDVTYFVKSGIEAIVEDDVTKRFSSEELKAWNLLSRTHSYQHINMQVTMLWVIGVIVRYFVLLPSRLCVGIFAILMVAVSSIIISLIPNAETRRKMNRWSTINSFRLFIRAFSGVITFHNSENKPVPGGICVANHTTPIDVIILGCDNVYAMVGQKHNGFTGMMQDIFSRSSPQMWFERSEAKDRTAVASRIRQHVEDHSKDPLLVFPEGTCINNTSVMMFKKGSFEVGAVIYPVAIKYDPRFADCFWNSSRYSLLRYLCMMMTSWAIKADVWYLPALHQKEDEDAISFANRVKKLIAVQGGLVDLPWDGALKREKPKESLKQVQQESYSRFIKTGLASK